MIDFCAICLFGEQTNLNQNLTQVVHTVKVKYVASTIMSLS